MPNWFKNLQLPNQKELSAGIGGILAWLLMLWLGRLGITVPTDVQGGIVAIVAAIIAKIVPPSQQDVVKHLNDTIAQAGTILDKLTPASDSTQPNTPAARALADKAA